MTDHAAWPGDRISAASGGGKGRGAGGGGGATPRGGGRGPARPIAKLARAADVRFEARAEVIAITATTLRRTTGHPEAPAIDIAANRAPSSGSWRDRGPCARQFHAVTGFEGRPWHVSGPLVSTDTFPRTTM